MSIEIINGLDAWENIKKNSYSKWPIKANPFRLYPIATPFSSAKFKIKKTDKIFCIGSCFAREIEQSLMKLNFDVLSIIRGLPKSARRLVNDPGMFNKYTAPSILNEIKWATKSYSDFEIDNVLIENSNGFYEDYQLSGQNYSDDLNSATIFRKAFNSSFKSIVNTDVLIITLGLSEAWFDNESKLFLNSAPSKSLVKKYPNRFELHVLDYNETLEMLEEMYQVIKTRCNQKIKILITVSPVPLIATFRTDDVFLANQYSKCLLRTVVEKFQHNKNDVNYFPSYEFVNLSNPLTVWGKDDFRHVESFFVQHIMGNVLTSFYEDISPSLIQSNALSLSSAMYKAKFFKDAEEVLKSFIQNPDEILLPKIYLRWGMIQRRLGNTKAAREAFETYCKLCPDDISAKETLTRLDN